MIGDHVIGDHVLGNSDRCSVSALGADTEAVQVSPEVIGFLDKVLMV